MASSETQDKVQATAPEQAPYEGRFGEIDSLRRQAARGTIVNAIYQVALAGIGSLKLLVAAALLTASDYGVWGLVALALWTVTELKELGVNEKYIQQSEEDQQLAFQRAFTVELIFAIVSLPAMAAVVVALAAVTGHPEVVAPGLALALIIPAAALQFPVWTFYRRMDFRRQRLLQGTDPVAAAVITIALAALGLGYWSLVAGVVCGAWLASALALRWSHYPIAIRFSREALRGYFRFSWPLAITNVATIAIFQVIYVTGNDAVGLAGLGALTLARSIIWSAVRADLVIMDSLYPALCAVQDRTAVLFEAFVKSNRLTLMWALPFGVGLSLFAADLVKFVIGEEWRAAVGLLQVMGIVTAVHHIGFNWHSFYRARGVTWPIAFSAVAEAAAAIASVIPFMYAFGVVGIGWAFAVAEVVAIIIRIAFMRRYFPGFQPFRRIVRAVWPTAIAAALLLALRGLGLSPDTLAGVVLELGGFLGVIALITFATERPLLREAFGYFGGELRLPGMSREAPAIR